MMEFIIAPLLIFVLLGVWIMVQHAARKFAMHHPELEPYREEGSGCGMCADDSCHGGHRRGCTEQTSLTSSCTHDCGEIKP